jgi:hypothetical protein
MKIPMVCPLTLRVCVRLERLALTVTKVQLPDVSFGLTGLLPNPTASSQPDIGQSHFASGLGVLRPLLEPSCPALIAGSLLRLLEIQGIFDLCSAGDSHAGVLRRGNKTGPVSHAH